MAVDIILHLLLVLVSSPHSSEPFYELLQFLIRDLGAPFPHVHKRDPPSLLGLPRCLDLLQPMTFCTRPIKEPDSLGIGKELGDLARNVGSRKRLRAGPKFRDQPVQQEITVWIGKISFSSLMLVRY